MKAFSSPYYDGHQLVQFVFDRASGLRAIVALHRERPIAGGGIRMKPYASDGEALGDVLRLSRAMSYKWAVAGLPAGGGKTALVHELARRRRDFALSQTPFWSTSGARVMMGTGFGMWQERCQQMCREAARTKAVVHLGNLTELLEESCPRD